MLDRGGGGGKNFRSMGGFRFVEATCRRKVHDAKRRASKKKIKRREGKKIIG